MNNLKISQNNCVIYCVLFIEGMEPLITYHFYDMPFQWDMLTNIEIGLGIDVPTEFTAQNGVVCCFIRSDNCDEEQVERSVGQCRLLSNISGLNYYDKVKKKIRNARKELQGK